MSPEVYPCDRTLTVISISGRPSSESLSERTYWYHHNRIGVEEHVIPMKDHTSVKMTTDLDSRHAWHYLFSWSFDEFPKAGCVVAIQPFGICCVEVDRAVQLTSPLKMSCPEMRMRDHYSLETALFFNPTRIFAVNTSFSSFFPRASRGDLPIDSLLVQIRNQVPQHISMLRLQKDSSLSNSERFLFIGSEAWSKRVPVCGRESGLNEPYALVVFILDKGILLLLLLESERCPSLPSRGDILAWILGVISVW